jgi:hypothetical protein
MAEPLLDLLNQNNWNQIYEEARTAQAAMEAGGYYPIPIFEIPLALQSRVLAVRCFSSTAKFTWRFAGNLKAQVSAPIAGINSPPLEVANIYLQLNRTKLVVLQPYVSNYNLVLENAPWLKDLKITIWEYTGAIEDTTEELIGIARVDILRVEAKIDDISNY